MQARIASLSALHELLFAAASGLISAPEVVGEAADFVKVRLARSPLLSAPLTSGLDQELLDTRIAGSSCIQRLAELVQRGEARLRLLLGSVALPGRAAALSEVQLGAGAEKREALESNDLVLLAECLYLAVQVPRATTLAEARSLLSVLSALAPSLSASPDEQAAVHAVLFSVLTVLDRSRLSDADAAALLDDDAFRSAEPPALRATLRLALGLARASGGEELLRSACEGGALSLLLSIMQQHQLRQRDLYAVTLHTLLTSFLDDSRGRTQVKLLFDTNQPAFAQLLRLLSILYRDGLEDLPSQCAPLWEFVDFVGEEVQKATERR